MSKNIIEKFDERGNRIYYKYSLSEIWQEYNKNNNWIYCKHGNNGWKCWRKFDEYNNCIYYKTNDGRECWYKNDENKHTRITEKEYNEIEFRKKEKEYNSRTKCSRFELMDI